jgi:hypothetical protein
MINFVPKNSLFIFKLKILIKYTGLTEQYLKEFVNNDSNHNFMNRRDGM